jgi:hypothetical protein
MLIFVAPQLISDLGFVYRYIELVRVTLARIYIEREREDPTQRERSKLSFAKVGSIEIR